VINEGSPTSKAHVNGHPHTTWLIQTVPVLKDLKPQEKNKKQLKD